MLDQTVKVIGPTALMIIVLASKSAGQLVERFTIEVANPNSFGNSVAAAGDVDGDGRGDIIIGAPLEAASSGLQSGAARVYSGFDRRLLYLFEGDNAGDQFGRSVAAAGDVNGDGFDDVIVGATLDDNNGAFSGSARVYSGFDGSILYTFNGDSGGDRLGSSVAGAGDINGDGLDDLIVGANLDDNNGTNSGSARVLSGLDGSVIYSFDGDGSGDEFGSSVSGAGDVNGDGIGDLIVGAPDDNNNGADSGSARVFSGFDGTVLYTFDGDRPGDEFGGSVSGAGDVNIDGHDDIIVGANGGSYARLFCSDDPLLGTNDDVITLIGVNNFFSEFREVRLALTDMVAIRVESPGGLFSLTPPVIAAQIVPNGTPLQGPLPEIHFDLSNPSSPILLFDGNNSGGFPPFGIGSGLTLPLGGIPPALSGHFARIQTLLVGTTMSNNGIFASTRAIDVFFP